MGLISSDTASILEDVLTSGSGNYVQVKDLAEKGRKFRVIQAPVIGHEYWTEVDGERKPKRIELGKPINLGEVEPNQYGGSSLKSWWGLAIYLHDTNSVAVLNVNQKSIQKQLLALDRSEEWGDLSEYDVKIEAEKGDFISYKVLPLKPMPLSDEAKEVIKNNPINLKALYSSESEPYGGNPFAESQVKSSETVINPDDLPF